GRAARVGHRADSRARAVRQPATRGPRLPSTGDYARAMPTVLLVRHGRTTANAGGILAGRAGGVRLDATGEDQAVRAGRRVAAIPLGRRVPSPRARCRQTAQVLVEQRADVPETTTAHGTTECDSGRWQGRARKALAAEPLWSVVQTQPSA